MESISVSDLPDLAGTLLNSDGESTHPIGPFLVPLDGTDADQATRAAARLEGRCSPLLFGHCSRPVRGDLAPLLSRFTLTLAPGGPGRLWVPLDESAVEDLARTVSAAPAAAWALGRLLVSGDRLEVLEALTLESATFSMLLGSPEFRRWRAEVPLAPTPAGGQQVQVHRDGSVLRVQLDRPERHNAFGHAMRDQLLEALTLAEADDTLTLVELSGRGASFCSGGDLSEFGTAGSPALAHMVRLQQSAGLKIHQLRERVRPVLHGACIGAGIEVPAFAERVAAREGTWFQLPEVAMGLIPGAGGTVSITRRVGRWRTAFLALSGRRLGLDVALDWGLVDARA